MLDFYSSFLNTVEADQLLQMALTMPLEQRFVNIKGMKFPMPRLTGWCNDLGFPYFYSGQATPPMPWPNELLPIRNRLEQLTGKALQSVLVNLYRDRNDSVSWHKDNEKWFKSDPFIVSLSVGSARKFKLRNKSTQEFANFNLSHGDVLIFTNQHVLEWEHCIEKCGHEVGPRANFTFRVISP